MEEELKNLSGLTLSKEEKEAITVRRKKYVNSELYIHNYMYKLAKNIDEKGLGHRNRFKKYYNPEKIKNTTQQIWNTLWFTPNNTAIIKNKEDIAKILKIKEGKPLTENEDDDDIYF